MNKNTTAAQPLDLALNRSAFISDLTYGVYKAEIADLIAQARAARPKREMPPEMKAAIEEAHKTGSTGALLPNGSAVFINYGHDYGDNEHLCCTACGGSGHIEDQQVRAAKPVQAGEAVDREWIQRTWMECNQDLFVFTQAVQARATLAPVTTQPVHQWDAANLRKACDDAAKVLRAVDHPLLANRLASNVESALGNGSVAPVAAQPATREAAYAKVLAMPDGPDVVGPVAAQQAAADDKTALRYNANLVREDIRRAVDRQAAAKAPAAQAVDAVTLDSALAAIGHINAHNGPGRRAEAFAMLVAASPASTPDASQQAAAVAAPSDEQIMRAYEQIVAYPERLTSGDYASAIKLVRHFAAPATAVAATTSEDARVLIEAGALRQFQHNDGSGLVFGYDKAITDRVQAHAEKDAERFQWLEQNRTWRTRYRIEGGKPIEWQMLDDGEPWGQWGELRAVIDAAMRATQKEGGK